MNRAVLARELVALAEGLVASAGVGSSFRLLRDLRTTKGVEFKTGEEVKVREYAREFPWTVRVEAADGRRMSLLVEGAHRSLSGFPKPPGLATLERWSTDGVARSVDGQRVEPDGFSVGGAPSWVLVSGLV